MGRSAPVGTEGVEGEQGGDLLERVRDAAADLLAGLPETPARLRVRAGGVELELDWAPAPATPAPGLAPAFAPALVPALNPAVSPALNPAGNGGLPVAGVGAPASVAGASAPVPVAGASHPVPVAGASLTASTDSASAPAPLATLTASTVGTFFRSPEPGAEPFVEVGDRVKVGQQVAIVEVMKLMIPVEADRDAVVVEVLAGDGESVEYGQALFALGPVG
ncbi:biotin/lipoyl-containing protein [Streptomyces sp. ST1015]|uniref:acetyl-CoA carboxylase biotin carboxyl carrier protein n=1 Tax=unclassified Streptomyces TaxID=2593676 RepID=UPI00223AE164|nr:biotin/lipoyl-containing protein [Streptomyces sp. ST1015]